MTVVPLEDPLQVEAFIKNENVGFVHADQRVKIKLSAYPFQDDKNMRLTPQEAGRER